MELLQLETNLNLRMKKCHVTHQPSCPHGTSSNKAFTLVWNRGVKGQCSLYSCLQPLVLKESLTLALLADS